MSLTRGAFPGAGTRRSGHGSAGGGRRPRRRHDAVPRPQRVVQIVAREQARRRRTGVIGGRHVRIVPPHLRLPFGPQPVDIAVQQEEQRILRGGRDRRDAAREIADMRGAVRIALHAPEIPVRTAERQRLRLGQDVRGGLRAGARAQLAPQDPLHAVGGPELQRVGRAETHRAERIRHADEVGGEQIRRRPIEAPIRDRHRGVDGLQLALQVEQIGPVPRQEAGAAMGLLIGTARDVHVAEIGEPPRPPVVDLRHGRDEAVPLGQGQLIRVLAHPHHDGQAAEFRRRPADHDTDVAVGLAGRAEFSANVDRHGGAARRQRHFERRGEVAIGRRTEPDGAAIGLAIFRQGCDHIRPRRGIEQAKPQWRRRPGEVARGCVTTVVDREVDSHARYLLVSA